MTTRRSFLTGLAGLATTAVTRFPAEAAALTSPPQAALIVPATDAGGRLVIMRGLYDVFSRGMDQIAKKFSALGVKSTLYNHSIWHIFADEIIAQYKAKQNVVPVILIGHSLGADATIVMSNWLAFNNVPVRLAVTFDAVAKTHPLTGNIQEVINFYKPHGYGQEIKAAPGFRGTINNVDLTDRKDIDHLNIDKDKTLQAEVIAKVLEVLKIKAPPEFQGVKAPGSDSSKPPVQPPLPPRKAVKKT